MAYQYKFGIGKYKTANGRDAEVLGFAPNNTLIGYISDAQYIDGFIPTSWRTDGSTTCRVDHLQVPEVCVEGFMNFYTVSEPCFHASREEADEHASIGRLACVPVKLHYKYGEGLQE